MKPLLNFFRLFILSGGKKKKIKAYSQFIIIFITVNGCGTKEGPNPGPGGAHYPLIRVQVEHAVINQVYPGWSPRMRYNHDADITLFKGRYVAAWNANPDGLEEAYPGQLNYISVSDDFQNWSTPVAAFTSAGGAINPVDDDFQWQANFINYKDSVLFCAWCVSGDNAATYVSRSFDGINWENMKLEDPMPGGYIPDVALQEKNASREPDPRGHQSLVRSLPVAFPGNHGLLTRDGTMLFMVGIPPEIRQVAALISKDGGKSWKWGECTPLLPTEKYLKSPKKGNVEHEYVNIWEPHSFEHPDGDIGMFIRVSGSMVNDGYKADQMILYTESNDCGLTFSWPETVDVETVSSRHIAFSSSFSSSDLIMAANDWLPNFPVNLRDRHYLSLYFSPVCDPDLLIPGPVIQQLGTTGHYPNGEVNDGEMIIAYSYGVQPRAIYASRITGFPDFTTPFFLERESRSLVQIDEETGIARFPETYSSLGFVLTEQLNHQNQLNLEFSLRLLTVPAFWPGQSDDEAVNGMTLLTVGATDRNNTGIRISRPIPPYHVEVLYENGWVKIAEAGLFEPLNFRLMISEDRFSVSFNDKEEFRGKGKIQRKINFGGFYTDPVAYPSSGTFELDLKSVRVY